GSRLYVVNVGSSDISVFDVTSSGLRLVEREPSGGTQPFSLTLRGGLLYVLNRGSEPAAAPANITAFTVSPTGMLTPLAGSTRPLSTPYPDPAQVSYTPNGLSLVVTEKATDKIDTYALGNDGRAISATPAVYASNGVTPFGFDFTTTGTLVVSEAFGGVVGEAATSSYSLAGGFSVISGSVQDTQSEVCWTAITHDDRFAYVTNFLTGTISSYTVNANGSITLLKAVAGRTAFGFGPRDEEFTADGRYLYVIDIGLTDEATRGVHGFRVESDGSLTALGVARISGYPAVAGLDAR
ncbi:MAG: beta-propeller fold lactonase family protein, partial [Gemmatimonadales bacterium]